MIKVTLQIQTCTIRSSKLYDVNLNIFLLTFDNSVLHINVRLSFVDLSGLQRYAKNHNNGKCPKDVGNANNSLMTFSLGRETWQWKGMYIKPDTILALCRSRDLIILYRDRKIMYLLKGLLFGEGRASMIFNIVRCPSMLPETLDVLKFSAILQVRTHRSLEVSMVTRTVLIEWLKSIIWGVKAWFLNGACRCILRG